VAVNETQRSIKRHLEQVLALPGLDVEAIRAKKFTVALDCVRGAGGTTIPQLLERLGCRVSGINLETDGKFPRAPEPLPENLGELSRLVRESGAVIGLAVDPDVDWLALVDETGRPIGEDTPWRSRLRPRRLRRAVEPPIRGRRQPLDQSCRRGCRPDVWRLLRPRRSG
jgi:phosphomannomutase